MHDIEHKSAQEEPASTPVQKSITTGRRKLPRAWRYTILGGTVLLALAVIFAGLLNLATQKAKQSAHPTPTPQLVNGVLYTTTTKILEPAAAHSASPLQGITAIGALLWNTLQNASSEQTLPLKQGLSSIYAIRASDGTVLWHYTMNNGQNSWASWYSVANGVVYASATATEGNTGTGDIYALQSSNGSVLWHDKLIASPSGTLLANGVIYFSTSTDSGGAIYAVRTGDGSLLWNYPTSGSVFAAPVLDGDALYIGANNGMAYALRADNGAVLWHYLTQVGG